MEQLTTLLERLGERWEPLEPADAAMLAAAERQLGVSLPADYRELMTTSNGGTITGKGTIVNFMPVNELAGFNQDDEITRPMPGIVAIADNGGGSFYYYDVSDRLGRGQWSVFLVEFGTMSFEYSIFAGATLTEMIAAIASGEDLERRPDVRSR